MMGLNEPSTDSFPYEFFVLSRNLLLENLLGFFFKFQSASDHRESNGAHSGNGDVTTDSHQIIDRPWVMKSTPEEYRMRPLP